MREIAFFSLKGVVGETTARVNTALHWRAGAYC